MPSCPQQLAFEHLPQLRVSSQAGCYSQQTPCLVRYLDPSFRVCFPTPCPPEPLFLFPPCPPGPSIPPALCPHMAPDPSHLSARPLLACVLQSSLSLRPPVLGPSFHHPPTWGKPVLRQLLFNQLRHVFQILQVMDCDGMRGAQGHWCECRLQAGQPIDGRGHFLKGGIRRLGGTGKEERGHPLPQVGKGVWVGGG